MNPDNIHRPRFIKTYTEIYRKSVEAIVQLANGGDGKIPRSSLNGDDIYIGVARYTVLEDGDEFSYRETLDLRSVYTESAFASILYVLADEVTTSPTHRASMINILSPILLPRERIVAKVSEDEKYPMLYGSFGLTHTSISTISMKRTLHNGSFIFIPDEESKPLELVGFGYRPLWKAEDLFGDEDGYDRFHNAVGAEIEKLVENNEGGLERAGRILGEVARDNTNNDVTVDDLRELIENAIAAAKKMADNSNDDDSLEEIMEDV